MFFVEDKNNEFSLSLINEQIVQYEVRLVKLESELDVALDTRHVTNEVISKTKIEIYKKALGDLKNIVKKISA